MLHEYAVEPACLDNWSTFRYLIEQFGVSEGRLVSQFPKDWYRRTMEACSTFTATQRWKMEIDLKRIKERASIKSGREFNGELSWHDNAAVQHGVKPFHAVVVKERRTANNFMLVAEDISHHDPLWSIARERKVARTVDSLSDAAAQLLRISTSIQFVDKMFNPYNIAEFPRWRDTLASFIQIACEGKEITPTFEYHCGLENEEFGKPEEQRLREFQEICNRQIAPILPNGCSITITRWDQNYRGDFFHDRYILTEKGGLRISWGLDRSKRPEETTDVTLLDESLWKDTKGMFNDHPPAFRKVDTSVVNG